MTHIYQNIPVFWDKVYFIIIDDLSDVFLDLVCKHFIEYLHLCLLGKLVCNSPCLLGLSVVCILD